MLDPDIAAGRYAASFYKSWIMAKRNFFTIFEVIFWPFIGLMSIGLMASFFSMRPEDISFILIGAIAFSIIQVCQIDIAYVMLFDMWSKSIKHTFIAPVRGHHLIIGSLLFGILRSSAVFVILMVLSFYAFGFNFLAGGVMPVLIFLSGLFLTSASIGILVCISILMFGQRAEVAAWTITGIMMFICGIYYPVSVLPASVQIIARGIPLTYFLEYMRSFYGFGEVNVLYGFALAIFYFIIGILALERAIIRARRSGILLRLSE
ncbi:MAG TPA: ABC transporter permease [Candidatus Methanoperedens sp.]|nr:ABC transporter permease [Candidatus Methanoperedens sp.]HLB70469.1 ABC transporter permease [Candidatus Methanoperedens sp.]